MKIYFFVKTQPDTLKACLYNNLMITKQLINMKKVIQFVFYFILSVQLFAQQPTQQWLNRFNGDGDFSDKFNCVVTDVNGNVYAAGYTINTGQRKDYLLVKYDNVGSLLWSVSYDGLGGKDDEVLAMCIDQNNHVIVTGYSKGNNTNDDIATVVYDQNGQFLWEAIYNNILFSLDDQGNSIAVDASGNIIVAGQTDVGTSSTSNDNFILISYSNNGIQNWIATYDGIGASKDRAVKVKIGSANSIYITGRSSNGMDDDIVTRKYTSLGVLAWSKTFNNGMDDRPADLKLDVSENVYVCGYSNNANNDDIVVLKYDLNGLDQWSGGFLYDGPNAKDDRASALEVNSSGEVFVIGKSDNDPNLTVNFDYKTIKINSTKNIVWEADFNGMGNGTDEASSIILLSSGDVVITGRSDSDVNALINNYDVKTICYSASTGAQSWLKTYSGTTGNDDLGNQLALNNLGNIFVVGSSQDAFAESDALTIQYSSSGTQNWTSLFKGIGDNTDVVNAIAVDAAGNTYLAGYSYSQSSLKDMCVIKLGPNGDTLWVKKHDGTANGNDEATDVKVDGSGNVYITGFTKESLTDFDITTIKYNSSGTILWTSQFDNSPVMGEDQGRKLEIDASGNVYVFGYVDRDPSNILNEDFVLLKYNNLGIQQWGKQINGVGNNSDLPVDMAYLTSGKIVVTGSSFNAVGTDFLTVAFNTSGTQLWTQTFSGMAGGNDAPSEMAFDNSENLVITGKTFNGLDYDALVIKYSSLGNQIWSAVYANGANDEKATAIDINSSGTIFVTGTTDDGTVSHIFVRSYTFAGVVGWTQIYDAGVVLNSKSNDIQVDNNGDIIIVGGTEANSINGLHWNYLVLKYSAAGNLWWTKTYDNSISVDDEIYVCEIDILNNIYVSGQSTSISGQGDIVTIKYDSPLNVNEISQNSLKIYPNPMTDIAFIDYDYQGLSNCSIEITDMKGQTIRTDVFNGKINRGELKPGIYLVRVFDENNTKGISRIVVE